MDHHLQTLNTPIIKEVEYNRQNKHVYRYTQRYACGVDMNTLTSACNLDKLITLAEIRSNLNALLESFIIVILWISVN